MKDLNHRQVEFYRTLAATTEGKTIPSGFSQFPLLDFGDSKFPILIYQGYQMRSWNQAAIENVDGVRAVHRQTVLYRQMDLYRRNFGVLGVGIFGV